MAASNWESTWRVVLMTTSVANSTLRLGVVLCGAAVLLCPAGCLIIDARVPDVRVEASLPPPDPAIECGAPVRYKPYGAALDRVVRQETVIQKELRKRDWDELGDELAEWQQYVRRLVGVADTSHDPARMRECCEALLEHIDAMRHGAVRMHAGAVRQALGEAAPVMNQMSTEFPLTEPAAPAPAAKTET